MSDIAFALVRAPSSQMADAELTHMARTPIDFALARQQHSAYRAALEAAGLEVRCLPALIGYPDCAFVEDAVLALPEILVELRPGAAARRGEVASVIAAVSDGRGAARIEAPATVDGGDVLPIGREIYVGLSTRTNADGVASLTAILQPLGYRVTAVQVARSLHLRTAVTALGEAIVLNPAWVDAAAFGARERIEAGRDEPFGANVVCVGETAIVQAAAPGVRAAIERAGWRTIAVDIGEFAKAEAGLTCMSVLVPRRA